MQSSELKSKKVETVGNITTKSLIPTRPMKLYTVEITGPPYGNVWYYSKMSKWFNCVLVPKETATGLLSCRFLVVESEGDGIVVPAHIRTISPEDCKIIMETTIRADKTAVNFIENFGRRENEQRKKRKALV